jgi:CRP-like cAMP-binding protein
MIDIPKLIKRMSRLKYFKGLSVGDITAIVKSGHIRKFNANDTIILEDEPCSGLFVLLSGAVYFYRLGPDGQEILTEAIKAITMFNEVAVLDNGPNPFTVRAAKDSRIWSADYETLQSLSERYPQVALGFLPIMAKRHRALISMVTDVCFLSVRARTAKLILDLSDHGRQPISRQENSIYKMSLQVSTVPEAISRSLSHFRGQGYITSSRTLITVHQPNELAQLAQIEFDPPAPNNQRSA